MFTKALVVLAAISSALAVPFITAPIASTTYSGGKPATVQWQDNGSQPDLAAFGPCRISIYAGNAQQQTSLQQLEASVDVSKQNSITFTPDPSIGPNSNEYFIRVESLALKDPTQPQYPALAFSAKFTLDSMTGTFSQAVLDQIKGQSTAPLAQPTATGTPAPNTNTATNKPATTAGTSKPAAATTAKPTTTGAAAALGAQAGWITALLGAVVGVSMF